MEHALALRCSVVGKVEQVRLVLTQLFADAYWAHSPQPGFVPTWASRAC